MESGQEITVGVWDEMVAELAEVRDKRDQLQAMNERVTDNLKRTIEEREQAVAATTELREEYLKHKEMANANSDQAASLRERIQILDAALQEMTAQRDTMTRYRDEMRVSRDEARKASADLQVQLSMWQVAHDTLKAERETVIRYRDEMRVSWDEARTAVAELQDTIEELRATNKQHQSDWAHAKETADMFEAENVALRDTVQRLRDEQMHTDMPGILLAIHRLAEQARELI